MNKEDIKNDIKKEKAKHSILEAALTACGATYMADRIGRVLKPVLLTAALCLANGGRYVYQTVRDYSVNSDAKTEWYNEHANADSISVKPSENIFYAGYKPTPEILEKLDYVRQNKETYTQELADLQAKSDSLGNKADQQLLADIEEHEAYLRFADVDPNDIMYEETLMFQGNSSTIADMQKGNDALKRELAARKQNPKEAAAKSQNAQARRMSLTNYMLKDKTR